MYKDGRHELLKETKETADQVLQDILDWLKRKLARLWCGTFFQTINPKNVMFNYEIFDLHTIV